MLANLADQLATRVVSSSCPERAMNNLEDFIIGVGKRKVFLRASARSTGAGATPGTVVRRFRVPVDIRRNPSPFDRAASSTTRTSCCTRADELEVELQRHPQGPRRRRTCEVEPELSLDALRLFPQSRARQCRVTRHGRPHHPRRCRRHRSPRLPKVCVERGLELAESEVTRRSGQTARVAAQAASFSSWRWASWPAVS